MRKLLAAAVLVVILILIYQHPEGAAQIVHHVTHAHWSNK